MSYMFYNCKKWSVTSRGTAPAPKNYNVSKVTNMSNMFYGCQSIYRMELPNWKTGNVTNMSAMFSGCSMLKYFDFTGWDTRKVTNMSDMFLSCTDINSIKLTSFSTPALTTMRQMFKQCTMLRSVDLSTFDLSNVSDMSHMFSSCKNSPVIDLRVSKKLKAGVNMYYMFYDTFDTKEDTGGVSLLVNSNFVVTTSQSCGWPSKVDYFNYCSFDLYTNANTVNTTIKNNAISTMKNLGWRGWDKGEKPEFTYRFANGKYQSIEY
jgi:surface protein